MPWGRSTGRRAIRPTAGPRPCRTPGAKTIGFVDPLGLSRVGSASSRYGLYGGTSQRLTGNSIYGGSQFSARPLGRTFGVGSRVTAGLRYNHTQLAMAADDMMPGMPGYRDRLLGVPPGGGGGSKPLLGNNPKPAKNRVNTDLPGGKSILKSIFRHLTRGQKKTFSKMPDGGIRMRAPDGTQMRFHPSGNIRIDLPGRGPKGIETIHPLP